MHFSHHIDTVPYSGNRTWCDLQNIALLDCVHVGINRVIAIRAMQRCAAGNIYKQPLTCNLYISEFMVYTCLTLYIQYEHTMYSYMFTRTLIFVRNLFMCLCPLLLAENIYLVMFLKYKLCPKPFQAYQSLLMFSDFVTYFFLVLMHVFQKDLLYYPDIGFRSGNLKIFFLKERVTSEDILTHDTAALALHAKKKFVVANKFIMRMLEAEGNGSQLFIFFFLKTKFEVKEW